MRILGYIFDENGNSGLENEKMVRNIIRKEEDCPIKPMDIDINNHFWGAFGNNETEISANYIIRFCRVKEGWSSYSGSIGF